MATIDELTKTELASALSTAHREAKLKQTQLYNEELIAIGTLIKELRSVAASENLQPARAKELLLLSRAAAEITRALQKPL